MKRRVAFLRWVARILHIPTRAVEPRTDMELATAGLAGISTVEERVAAFRDLAERTNVPLGLLADRPWLRLREIRDEPGRCYMWVLGKDQQDGELADFHEALVLEFLHQTGHEPRSLHLIVREPADVQELTPAQIRASVKPWLLEVP